MCQLLCLYPVAGSLSSTRVQPGFKLSPWVSHTDCLLLHKGREWKRVRHPQNLPILECCVVPCDMVTSGVEEWRRRRRCGWPQYPKVRFRLVSPRPIYKCVCWCWIASQMYLLILGYCGVCLVGVPFTVMRNSSAGQVSAIISEICWSGALVIRDSNMCDVLLVNRLTFAMRWGWATQLDVRWWEMGKGIQSRDWISNLVSKPGVERADHTWDASDQSIRGKCFSKCATNIRVWQGVYWVGPDWKTDFWLTWFKRIL